MRSPPPRLFAWAVAGLTAAACRADAPLGPDRADGPPSANAAVAAQPPVGAWTLILADSTGHIAIAQTDGGASLEAASLWTRLDSQPALRGLTLKVRLPVIDLASTMQWELRGPGGEPWLAGAARGPNKNRRHGVWQARGATTGSLSGGARQRLWFQLISDTPMPVPVADPVAHGTLVVKTPAIVSLRIDDCLAKDAVAFELLKTLGMTAELAVPSRWVGRPRHCTPALLNAMVAAGNTVGAHSRFHGSAPQSFGDFYLEVVGGAQDLRRRGFQPWTFIAPGTWRNGPTLFDTADKLNSPYGQLLRRVYLSTEAYALRAAIAIPTPTRDGPVSWPLAAFTMPALETRVRQAATDGQWISFMWHVWDMQPGLLEAKLRLIAALRDSGLVTVLPYYTALHATH